MNRFRRSIARCGLVVLAVLVCSLPGLAQQTLGSVNGTVLDPSQAAVSGATVIVTNTSINVIEETTTQKTGFFQIFNLPIGIYAVKISHEGFETEELKGIAVQEARATTVNATLKVGAATASVIVTGTPLLNATDTTNGYTMDSAQIELTPLATGSFTQLAVLSPGVNAELLSGINSNGGLGNQNIWANGQRATSNTFQVNGVDATNLFNGMTSSGLTSQRYNFNIGGGSPSNVSSAGAALIGGASPVGTSVYGSVGNSLPSPPPEFLQELRVNTSMYDAQQGATAGAQIDVNTKTGSNDWHGQVFGTFANNSMNSAPYFFKQQYELAEQGVGAFPQSLVIPPLHRWTTGATVGGPVKKNKAFFFLAYEHLYGSDQSTGLSQFTVPTALTNDSSSRTNNPGSSTSGLQAVATAWNNGHAFTSAVDPIALALMNATLPDGSYLIPGNQVPSQPYMYGVPNVTLIGTSLMTGDQANAAVDYDLNSKDRIEAKYFYQNDPVTKPYGFSSTGGFPVSQNNGSQVGAIDNTIVIGSHLNWEQRLGYFRQDSYSYYTQTLVNSGGPANFGIGSANNSGINLASGLPGLLLKDFPSVQHDAPGLKVGPFSSFANTGFYQNRLNPSTNVIFAKGNHTIVAGGGYSYTQLNVENWRNGIAQVATKNFQTFLTGQVSSSDVVDSIVNGHNDANRYYRTNELDWYVQDKWQALPNLSVTAGVRYDYHGGMTEKYGNMFNFDPSLYSVTGTTTTGFTVTNAGFVVAGNSSNPTPGVSDSTLTGRQWGISPRIGFAWAPRFDKGKFVVRGGGGIYFDRGENLQYLSQPAGSGYGGPFGVTESAPLVSYVVGAATPHQACGPISGNTGKLCLENPIGGSPIYVAPSSNPATMNTVLQSTLNGMTGQSTYYGPKCGGVDSQEGYTDCPDALNFGAYDKNNVLPYTMNYTLNIQWQPANDVAFTLGYTGNRGRHAVIPIPFNEPGIATSGNPIWGETASYGFEVLNQNPPFADSDDDYAPIPGEPWNTEDGGNTDFRAPYVGFSPNAALYKTVGNSAYDALETHLEKRLSHHFMTGASYTWSHTLDEQSDIGLFFTGNNPNKLRNSWASADFDRTQVFSANFEVLAPNFAKPHSVASIFENDWSATGIAILQSGEPYSLYEFYGAVGSINFGDFPTLMNPVLGVKNPSNRKSAMTGNSGKNRGTAGSYIPTIDPTQIAINYLAPGTDGIPTQVSGYPADIYETDFAPTGQRNLFRQSSQKRLDISIRKDIHATGRFNLQYEFNIFNITNTTSLDVPEDTAQIRQNSACSASATTAGYNCSPGSFYFVNYGQIVTSSSPADQQSALANLDEPPYSTGAGVGLNVPEFIPLNATGSCVTGGSNVTTNAQGCPNNAATFGSVNNTIGSNRIVTMGLRMTF